MMEATMGDSSYSDHPVLNDIFDDEPTQPDVSLAEAQRQLDGATSVAEGFLARGKSLGYREGRKEPVPQWIERLERELEEVRS
jgi:hypothetical protein